MSDLITCTLEDICLKEKGSIISGPFGSNISSKYFVSSGIPVIRGNNLTTDHIKFIDDGFVYVTEEKANELHCDAYADDLIFTAAGTIGQVGIIPKNTKYNRYVISNKQIRVRLDTELVDLDYAYCWFVSPWIQTALKNNNKGSTVPLLTLAEVRSLPITYPKDKGEQKAIAKVFNDLDAKIDNNVAICSDLEAIAKLLYDYWFVQFDFPDENGKPYKFSGGKMVWNEELKREIPDGWEVKSLSEICNLSNGINYDKNEQGDKEYKIVNVRNITATSLLLDEEDFDRITLKSSLGDKYLIHDNDILIARSGTPGAIRLLEEVNDNTIYCGFIIRCSLYDKALRNYICFYLKMFEGTNTTKTGGSILQNVSQETLNMIKIPMPKADLITSFNQSTEPIIKSMQNGINENQELASLRDFLLPMLMNGQVKVKKGENL